MSRKKFIEGLGATCDNWRWSWSYVNHAERFVVFGAWDIHEENYRCKILAPDWQIKDDGKKNGGFKQSLRHIQLIENEGYSLKTFRIFHSDGNPITGTARIKGFVAKEVDRVLVKEENAWFAYVTAARPELSEDLGRTDNIFIEGSRSEVNGEKATRNGDAREECLRLFGLDCAVCSFNFENSFGPHGKGFIHVHHLNPVASTSGAYEIDPKDDLRPVCPNCHAMLHRGQGTEPLSIQELKNIIKETAKP